MKKAMSISFVIIMITILFASCTFSKSMKDGIYKAEYEKADDYGWTDYVVITVTDKKIINVEFDAVNSEGDKKTQNAEYEASMKEKATTWPSEFYPKLASKLVEKQNIEDVDVVSGATNTSNDFKKLVKELETSMSKGDTDTVKVKR